MACNSCPAPLPAIIVYTIPYHENACGYQQAGACDCVVSNDDACRLADEALVSNERDLCAALKALRYGDVRRYSELVSAAARREMLAHALLHSSAHRCTIKKQLLSVL